MDKYNLERFVIAGDEFYPKALKEIKNGYKESHWMWFIFPQLRGLGTSDYSDYYGIEDIDEAKRFMEHPILSKRLIEITSVLLTIEELSARDIFGFIDELKLHSSMTLFSLVSEEKSIFHQVLDGFFNGKLDESTIKLINHRRK